MDARVTVDPIFTAFGVPATVTRPGQEPIDTTAVWVPEDTQSSRWGSQDRTGLEIARVFARRVIAFRVDEVPAAPVGTLIVAPEELGQESQRWRVDEIERVESDLIRLFVVPTPSTEFLQSWGKS